MIKTKKNIVYVTLLTTFMFVLLNVFSIYENNSIFFLLIIILLELGYIALVSIRVKQLGINMSEQ